MKHQEIACFKKNEYSPPVCADIFPGKLRIATATHVYYLDLKGIVHIQSISNYSKIFFSSGQTLTVSKVLAWFDELLCTRHFLRIHRTHLINLVYLKRYVPGNEATVALSNDVEIPVARRKKKALKQKMMAMYLQNQ